MTDEKLVISDIYGNLTESSPGAKERHMDQYLEMKRTIKAKSYVMVHQTR